VFGRAARERSVARRRVDVALAGFAVVGFGLWIAMWVVLLSNPGFFGRFYGQDLAVCLEAARRWLGGGGFYHDYQLSGPYAHPFGDVLYPPPTLILFAAFTILPTLLWWLIPAALLVHAIARLRPAPWALAAMVGCLWWPDTSYVIVWGNPALWVAAALALGATRPFFAPFAMLKMTLAPAALINVRRREWWAGFGVLVAVSLAFLPMWPEYVTAIANLRVNAPLAYSLGQVPLVAIPWLAWLGRTRG
jgi:hypothetical protein